MMRGKSKILSGTESQFGKKFNEKTSLHSLAKLTHLLTKGDFEVRLSTNVHLLLSPCIFDLFFYNSFKDKLRLY
ncbi:hypothetical protein T07_5469 [Trichinella nelsoni]|uniref:Uncharacterized protein n=1 Tax=Trichinella nelsoni TaxID=6336 RepID=A0A0V0RQP3_9BILA|nr:hypothetical protein T07_5469 [Trichinella nelsoni]